MANTTPQAGKTGNLLDSIYGAVTRLFPSGKSNKQYFMMMFPTLALNPASYQWDRRRTNGNKPASVEKSEFLLADQAYNVAKIQGAPNGQSLSTQYRSSLTRLVPKLSADLIEAQEKLKEAFSAPATGAPLPNSSSMSKIEAYYILHDEWNQTKRRWLKAKSDYAAQLSAHPEFRSELRDWIKLNYGQFVPFINEAHDKMKAVFTDEEHGYIEAVLNATKSAGIAKAQETLSNVGWPDEDGTKVFPVEFSPNNWGEGLVSNYAPVDLLAQPEFIADKLESLIYVVNRELTSLFQFINSTSVDASTIHRDQKNVERTLKAYQNAQDAYVNTVSSNTVTAVKMYLAHKQKSGKPMPNKVTEEDKKEIKGIEKGLGASNPDGAANKEKTGSGLSDEEWQQLLDGQKALVAGTSTMVHSAQSYIDSVQKLMTDKAAMISEPIKASIDATIATLKPKLSQLQTQYVNFMQSNGRKSSGDSIKEILDKAEDSNYQVVTLQTNSREWGASHEEQADASQTSWSVSLFFGSASGHSEESSSSQADSSFDTSSSIDIGFLCQRVDIVRPWMDLGVFGDTENFHRITENPIASGPPSDWASADPDRWNEDTFPAVPVSVVVVKDVTIKVKLTANASSSASSALERHSHVGGGFLCFGASHSESHESSSQSFHFNVDSQTATIRIPGPQILGYFMQFVDEDQSDYDADARGIGVDVDAFLRAVST